MRNQVVCVFVIATGLAVGGCASKSLKGALGLGKKSPDEYQVAVNAPLELPPDYYLRPPSPGAERPQAVAVRDQAERILTGADPDQDSFGQSDGETAMLRRAGADAVEPDIRNVVNQESGVLAADDESFVTGLMFWQDTVPQGTVVDPVAESERLQENADAGLPATHGATPVIKRKERAPLEGLNPF